jgi:uncharacterized protein (DUF58 family)
MRSRRLNLPWRQPEPERGPLVINARRLYILPTGPGFAFAALCVGVLVAAANYSLSLGYLFSFLLAGLGMAGLLHTHRNLLGLTLHPIAPLPVYAGEIATFRILVDNPNPRQRGAVTLTLGGETTEADIPERGQAELEIALPQRWRGYHPVDRLNLATRWPLGLFRCWSVFAFEWGILVYPRPAPDAIPFPEANAQGAGRASSQPGDEEFHGLRDYQPGDPFSRIAWKSLARGRPPLTKQFAETRADHIDIDWHATPERETEARLSRLTRWVIDAERSGRAWSLTLPGQRLPPGRGDGHLKQALESLARHEPS